MVGDCSGWLLRIVARNWHPELRSWSNSGGNDDAKSSTVGSMDDDLRSRSNVWGTGDVDVLILVVRNDSGMAGDRGSRRSRR